MLSYRHSFHAGNFADVLKHLIEVEILEYLARKDKPYVYIDTHAAAGLYQLDSLEAGKNREYETGIAPLLEANWPEVQSYLDVVRACQELADEPLYPGSPWFAMHMMRDDDRAFLFELHPRDLAQLEDLTYRDRRVRVNGEDGFAGLISLLPPTLKRGLILMDPPYEIKTDYQQVVKTLVAAHRRFATGTYALWYPVVDRSRIDELERAFVASGIANIQLFELGIEADRDGRGMTSSGMLVINPPYVLMGRMKTLLPRLADLLGRDGQGCWRAVELVGENG